MCLCCKCDGGSRRHFTVAVFFAKSKYRMLSMYILCICAGALSFALTMSQMDPSNGNDEVAWNKTCHKDTIGYLSPFEFSESGGKLQMCPWPQSNTVTRGIIGCADMVVGLICAILVHRGVQRGTIWSATRYLFLAGGLMAFAISVLDADHSNTGRWICNEDFTIDDNPIIDTAIIDNIQSCEYLKFVYTVVSDYLLAILNAVAFLSMKYYPVPKKREDEGGHRRGDRHREKKRRGGGRKKRSRRDVHPEYDDDEIL